MIFLPYILLTAVSSTPSYPEPRSLDGYASIYAPVKTQVKTGQNLYMVINSTDND